MRRKIAVALVALLTCGSPALAGEGENRISGRVVEIRPDGKLVIEEQGPWQGPGTGVITRAVELSPATSVAVVQPTGTWAPGAPSPGYDMQPADFRALRPGDFVTVTTGDGSQAVAVEVMRTDGADAGLASPRESGR